MVGVGRAGKAVDAAVLAAPVSIHRAVKTDVGGLVSGDDGLGMLDGDGRAQCWQHAIYVRLRVQPVAIRLALKQVKSCAPLIMRGATALPWLMCFALLHA